ncbi:MAG: anthranilate phosphoribosyltransferase [Chloroflexi bacterium]|nr:anthranilate phosphoribosyltransferase [Chloroflexota bacterium]
MAESAEVMEEIMTGLATPAQFASFVTALRMKGETVEEIAGLASVMRAKATPVRVSVPVVDTCGTGADSQGTFNISTTAALVVAGAGVTVAKHGNRAISSKCGSADLLEGLGVNLDLTADQVAQCLETVGVGFMYSPLFHPAMQYAGPPRREIGIRTVFNILGPLTSPAGARSQVMGVADGRLAYKLARVFGLLGAKHALVVNGLEGLDEISICGPSRVHEVRAGEEPVVFELTPEEFGLQRATVDDIKGGGVEDNVRVARAVFNGERGAARDVVLLNAAAALLAADRVANMADGVRVAAEAIDSGRVQAKLEEFVAFTRSFA